MASWNSIVIFAKINCSICFLDGDGSDPGRRVAAAPPLFGLDSPFFLHQSSAVEPKTPSLFTVWPIPLFNRNLAHATAPKLAQASETKQHQHPPFYSRPWQQRQRKKHNAPRKQDDSENNETVVLQLKEKLLHLQSKYENKLVLSTQEYQRLIYILSFSILLQNLQIFAKFSCSPSIFFIFVGTSLIQLAFESIEDPVGSGRTTFDTLESEIDTNVDYNRTKRCDVRD